MYMNPMHIYTIWVGLKLFLMWQHSSMPFFFNKDFIKHILKNSLDLQCLPLLLIPIEHKED